MRWRPLLFWLALAGLGACSPTLNWREVRPEGSAARAWFPCRPVGHDRDVQLAGASVHMSLHACKAGDAVFGLGFADMRDAGKVTAALQELRESAARNLGTSADAVASPLTVAGMTPNPQSGQLRLAGRRPDGAAVQEHLAVFAHGTVVYQATVLGSTLDDAAVRVFVDGLQVGP